MGKHESDEVQECCEGTHADASFHPLKSTEPEKLLMSLVGKVLKMERISMVRNEKGSGAINRGAWL
jgi:hypothetical protein